MRRGPRPPWKGLHSAAATSLAQHLKRGHAGQDSWLLDMLPWSAPEDWAAVGQAAAGQAARGSPP
jgi:hypothetical protein